LPSSLFDLKLSINEWRLSDRLVCKSFIQVLGIPKNADYNAIQRAYKKKISDFRGNDAETSRVEAAHSSLMMNALTSRLQGNAEVDKSVLYADRARYFPWRPKLFIAETKVIMYSAIAQFAFLAWALLSPMTAGTQPVVWCTFFMLVSFVFIPESESVSDTIEYIHFDIDTCDFLLLCSRDCWGSGKYLQTESNQPTTSQGHGGQRRREKAGRQEHSSRCILGLYGYI